MTTPRFWWRTDAEAHRAQERTHEIDQFLDEEAEKTKNTHKIVLFGDTSEIEVLTRQIAIFTCTATICYDDPDKRSLYRDAVRETVLDILEQVGLSVKGINEMELLSSGDGMDKGAFSSHIETLRSIIRPSGNNIAWNKIITSQTIDAVLTLSKSEAFVHLARKTCNSGYMYCIPYFLHELQRIAEPDYIPTKSDIVRAPSRLFSSTAMIIPVDRGTVQFVVPGLRGGERRKWIHLLDDFTEMMFLYDLAIYDHGPGIAPEPLDAYLATFDSVVNSQFFGRRRSSRNNRSGDPIILLLGNVSVLKEKLPRSPFGTFYADYTGENNVEGVVDYTIKRFREIGKQRLVIYPYTVDVADSASWTDVWEDIQKDVLCNMASRGDLKG